MGTNKAEELIKKLEILEDSCDSNLALVVNGYSSGVSDSIKIVKEYLTNRQSEIDELTKEVERLKVLNKRLFTLWESLYSPNKLII